MGKSQSLGAICHAALWDFDRSAGDPDTPDAWEAAAQAVRSKVIEEAIEALRKRRWSNSSYEAVWTARERACAALAMEADIKALTALKSATNDREAE